jgi:hypothetical protein
VSRAAHKTEAAQVSRSLIDQAMPISEGENLVIALRGDLAVILRLVAGKNNPASSR